MEAFSFRRGQGARFTVCLPLVENAPAPAQAPSTDSHISRRVLVIDDNCDVAESLTTLLELIGYDAATAYNPFAAFETAARFSPKVVLLDIGLPQLDGYEMARRMREIPERAGAHLIAPTPAMDDPKISGARRKPASTIIW